MFDKEHPSSTNQSKKRKEKITLQLISNIQLINQKEIGQKGRNLHIFTSSSSSSLPDNSFFLRKRGCLNSSPFTFHTGRSHSKGNFSYDDLSLQP